MRSGIDTGTGFGIVCCTCAFRTERAKENRVSGRIERDGCASADQQTENNNQFRQLVGPWHQSGVSQIESRRPSRPSRA